MMHGQQLPPPEPDADLEIRGMNRARRKRLLVGAGVLLAIPLLAGLYLLGGRAAAGVCRRTALRTLR